MVLFFKLFKLQNMLAAMMFRFPQQVCLLRYTKKTAA
jgi:hypothetical protein